MASQPVARPWFRLSTMARPPQPAPPTQETQPAAPILLQRPPILRPTFTTLRPPTPPPPTISEPPPTVSEPPPPPPVSSQPPPQSPPRPTVSATSMPQSPVSRNSIYPNLALGSPASTRIPVTSSSVPSSPTTKALAPTNVSPVSNSPLPKISTPSRNSPVYQTAVSSPAKTNSPVPRTVGTVSPLPTSAVPNNSPASKFIVTNSVQDSSSPKLKSLSSPSASNGGAVTTTARLPTPSSSPKITKQPLAKSPPNSPNIKASAPPPSPLLLPPSMLNPDTETAPKIPIEAEQKSVVMQKIIEKPSPNWVNGKSQTSVQNPSAYHVKTHEKGSHHKKSHDAEENGMRVITIAGENRGAFMELSHSHKKHGHFEGITHSLLHKKSGNESDTSSSDEGKSKMKDNNHKNTVNAYMNSNVQGVNNSIVFNSSYSHHDPGVHLSLTRKPNGGGYHKMTQAKDATQHSSDHHS